MELAAWNVCPEDAPHGNDCLFEKDQTFQTLKGTLSESVGGVPPGKYQVVIKHDYFDKVRGAVRNSKELEVYSRNVAKVSTAMDAAHAGWEQEIRQLQVCPCLLHHYSSTTTLAKVADFMFSKCTNSVPNTP
jgi:hypothetical protein